MKNFFLVFACVVLGCTNLHNESKSTPVETNDTLHSAGEQEQVQKLSLVFDLPIKKGSYLERQREDNADFPADFQVSDGKFYILSSEEKKIIGFDEQKKEFFSYEKIHRYLLNEKENNAVSEPIFLRLTNNYIIVGYDFKLLVFSLSEELLFKTIFRTRLQYMTVYGDKLNLWFYDYALQINPGNKSDSQQVMYGGKSIDFTGIKVHDKEKLSTGLSVYNIEGGTLNEKKITYTPYHLFPGMKKESFSLNCITPLYYVWYPWTQGDKLVLINKETGSEKIIDLGFNLVKDNLSYLEDREEGLKVTNDGDRLYFMVMKNIDGQKTIRVYQMQAK